LSINVNRKNGKKPDFEVPDFVFFYKVLNIIYHGVKSLKD
jgi:hypothetical protein